MMNSILTVTTTASSYDLTSLANVKAELDINDGASDTVLRRYITGASLAASHYCNRVFAVETVSEQFLAGSSAHRWHWRNGPLQLQRYPLITVTSITEDGTLLVVDDDYVVDSINGQLRRVDSDGLVLAWPCVLITAVYSAGYATTPADLEDAVIRMVTQRYSAKGRDATLRQETIPGVREATYWIATGAEAGALTPDVVDLLDRYRAVVVA
jgi:uncharacterized phiE125 gp8 family phage protein